MELRYRPDWPEVRERYIQWWNGEYFGRAMLWVTAPRDGAKDEPAPAQPEDPLERWTNLEYLSALNDWQHRRTLHLGEAFPIWHMGYPGAVSVPTFLGSEITLDLRTGWHEPALTGEDFEPEDIRLTTSGFWYEFGLKLLRHASAVSRGKCMPSIGAFGGTGDTLGALRDSNRLLYDVMDRPQKVMRAEKLIMDAWIRIFSTFHDLVRDASDGGTTCWFNLWAPGKFYPTHNDFSYMISPAMFRKLFLPQLIRQTEFLDYTVYHCDGINAFVHVPMLCELPRLQAIQILPGAGKPSPLHYREAIEYVQRAGKNLHITIPSDEVETAVDTLSAKGLCIATSAESESEARRLMEIVQRKSRVRKL
jgi:hypothetical protein